MKRFWALVLCIVLSVGAFVPAVLAAPAPNSTETVTVFSDGSYCITTITDEDTGISPASVQTVHNKYGHKTVNFYNATDTLLFTVTVYGYFQYNGTDAWATGSSYSYEIYSSAWQFVSATADYSGATAYVNASFKYLLSNRSAYVALTCSPTGELS